MAEPDIDVSLDPELSETPAGPGHRLRQARERKGLAIAEAAERLHLPPRHVSAIEGDDYTGLPGAVFVQGYLRNYARLVDEPVDEIVNMFNAVRPREEYKPALRQFQFPMKANQVNSSHGVVKAVTWLIVIALMVLLIVWWRGYIKLPVPVLGEDERPEAGATDDPAFPSRPAPPSAVPGKPTVLQVPQTQDAVEGSPGDTRTGADSTRAPGSTAGAGIPPFLDNADSQLPVGEGAAGQTGAPKSEEQEPGPDDSDRPAVPDPAERPAKPAGNSGASSVKLAFEAPCWVDIRDALGEKVLYGGIDAGETFTLAGTPPYQVVLGNSNAVKITVAGKDFPTDEHSRGRVARFVLDPAKALMAANGSER